MLSQPVPLGSMYREREQRGEGTDERCISISVSLAGDRASPLLGAGSGVLGAGRQAPSSEESTLTSGSQTQPNP